MKSMWKVREREVAGAIFYQLYRTNDAAKKADRIETYGGLWPTEEEALKLAKLKNREDGWDV